LVFGATNLLLLLAFLVAAVLGTSLGLRGGVGLWLMLHLPTLHFQIHRWRSRRGARLESSLQFSC